MNPYYRNNEIEPLKSCADSGIFFRCVQARRPENSLDYLFFLSPTYFTVYREGPMVLLQRKLYFSKDPEGVQHLLGGGGGVQLSPGGGGVQMLNSIETHITCDFPRGGVQTPIPPPPPLWIRTCKQTTIRILYSINNQ